MWKIRVEIEVEPGDLDLDPGYTKGFMNVVTWASSEQSAREKLTTYLSTFNWKMLGVEGSEPIDSENVVPKSEIVELAEKAKENPNAIVLGTFHSYLQK
jgi:hypothetical protein